MDVVRKIVKVPGGEYDVARERGDLVVRGLVAGGDHVEGCASWPARCA